MNPRALVTLLLLLVPALAIAQSAEGKARQQGKPPTPASITKEQAIDKASRQVKGRVLRVDARDKRAYRVKVLKRSGRVVNLDVDRNSGQVRRAGPKPRRSADKRER